MNEGIKTGIFWVIAVVMISIAAFVAWPTAVDDVGETVVGNMLFEKFSDPLAAASMQIVTFDEEQGQLKTFEVRKDQVSGLWTIPSRNGYPADAIEQMKVAGNTLIDLKILDIQTSNAEDHDDLGVAEPKIESLQLGDEGVGRQVTFKDEAQETLASLIIGDPPKGEPEKRYVRIPGQDPVYVVKLDESPLTTKFRDWIEDDLLQLSSIDIADMEIKDYTAALGANNQLSLARNYTATVTMDGADWVLNQLFEYDPQNPRSEAKQVQVKPDEKLNKFKLDTMKNVLDDLIFVDVIRKPDGMSANLRANQNLLSDNDAMASLGQRGFYPLRLSEGGEMEIVSANGELSVSLADGVKYVMRFGNISGVTNTEDSSRGQEEVDAGVNRYMLVTTVVDQSKFPPPELRPVPQTLEDLDALLNPDKKKDAADEDSEADEASDPEEDGESDDADDEADDEVPDDEKLTEEELLERLEAEQEKITKANQRMLDERKDKLEAAERRVRDLNARFADWYYVIAEDTYSQLRIRKDELFQNGSVLPATPKTQQQNAIPEFKFPGT